MKVAVIHIDSHSLQLTLATLAEDGTIAILGDFCQDAGISERISREGHLDPESVAVVVAGLKSFRHIVRQQTGLDQFKVYGTSGLGRAPNAKQFLDRVQQAVDVPATVLSANDEVAYSYLANHDTIPPSPGQMLVTVEVGGDGTRIAVGDGERLLEVFTVHHGASTLTRKFLNSLAPSPEDCLQLSEFLNEKLNLDAVKKTIGSRSFTLVSAGRNITALVNMAQGSSDHDRSRVHGSTLSLETIYEWYCLLARTPVNQRAEFPGLPLALAQVILAGAGLHLFVMDKLGIGETVVSDNGIRHGMVRELLGLERPFQ
ncbi:MAG: hypothetical protein HY815_09235 [Candidatus Riflebacteria bacterium]|nr:hypothetical protein [Candidatus Riflebacteria bacterium]